MIPAYLILVLVLQTWGTSDDGLPLSVPSDSPTIAELAPPPMLKP